MNKKFALTAMSILLLANVTMSSADARGGFGGGGFGGGRGFGGGFDRGGFDRGDFGRGGDFDRGFNDMFDHQGDAARADAFSRDNQGITGGETGVRDWSGATARAADLSSDMGLGRIASPLAGGLGRFGTYRLNPADLAGQTAAVRGAYNHWDYFHGDWWRNHPWYWYNRYWGDDWAWGWADWGDLGGWWGMDVASDPVYYDYGNNITYNNNQVYYGSQPLESADAYYQQAETLAQSAPPAPTTPLTDEQQKKSVNDMKSLGVYALVSGDQNSSSQLIQLAVDKKGYIRGTYYNEITGDSKPISGAVDKKSQRASFIIGDNKKTVYDTAVGNLLKDSSPILVHYSKTNTQQLVLVRMKKPAA